MYLQASGTQRQGKEYLKVSRVTMGLLISQNLTKALEIQQYLHHLPCA